MCEQVEPPESPRDGGPSFASTASDELEHYTCDDPPTCRPSLPRMKSCLKNSPSQSGTSTPIESDTTYELKKRVAFSESGMEEVYEADEWDRTPADVAQRLSYEDILELKQIQRSLPRAEQPHDPLSSRPHSVFLKHVPIPLLPFNPTTISASPSTPSPTTSPSPHSPPSTPPVYAYKPPAFIPPPPPPPRPTTSTPFSPPSGSNLPPPRRTFQFLTLLDETSANSTPPPSTPSTPVIHPTSSSMLCPPASDALDTTYPSDTESSTPSLTTASLSPAPSLPSDSPAPSPAPSPTIYHTHHDDDQDDDFILNLDVDADVDPSAQHANYNPYFPPISPFHAKFPSQHRAPVSSFHTRFPNTHSVVKPASVAQKLILEAVPSPGLPAPSPLELSQASPLDFEQSRGPPRIRMPVLPLMDADASLPSPPKDVSLFAIDHREVLSPSLSRRTH
ncbi:hypothetical protein BV22DRAFT_1035481 [Leucogyrophana mollusca]|uniref:Uncharacterized protein n=1 Tax=Leucogyrophana mollusca TaxID=85980 RepID=A0ACB8BEM7_9AGAM|nr:hypothetical protein BV22DRAFT_1035481 [Leucogyrophana mollusca]